MALVSLVVKKVKNPPATQETWIHSLVGKIPWRGEWLHSPVFWPAEFPWIGEPGCLQSTGSQRVRHTEQLSLSLPHVASGKEPTVNAGDIRDTGLDPWVGKIPWRRAWQHTSVFLPGESHGQRSLAGYSPWVLQRVGLPSLSQWCHPTTSSSINLFSSCPQSFPASGAFPMSQLFTSGDQNIGPSASVLPWIFRADFL